MSTQAPECCPFCGAGIGIFGSGTTFLCGSWKHRNGDVDQSRDCVTKQRDLLSTERERLTRERDEARKLDVQATQHCVDVMNERDAALARVHQLESEWSGWPALQREWFGGRYAAMQPWDAVRARIEDDAERIRRLERLVDGVHYVDGVHLEEVDGLNWFDARTAAKEATP